MSDTIYVDIPHKCPECGKSYYQVLYSTSTCLNWSPKPLYHNGKLINSNTITTNCQCLECGAHFAFQE